MQQLSIKTKKYTVTYNLRLTCLASENEKKNQNRIECGPRINLCITLLNFLVLTLGGATALNKTDFLQNQAYQREFCHHKEEILKKNETPNDCRKFQT